MTEEDTSALTAALANANGFDLASLEANRAGHLSDKQRIYLEGMARFYLKCRNIGMIVAVASIVIALYGLLHQNIDPRPLYWGLIGILCGLTWLVTMAYEHIKHAADVSERIAKYSGFVDKYKSGSGSDATYCYVVGDRKFWVDQDAYEVLVPKVPYHLYYLAHTVKMLSIEPDQHGST